jgi:hypothetical protein
MERVGSIMTIKETDVFGYFFTKKDGDFDCPKCEMESLVNLNFNDKITCVNPKCDWEWNRYDKKNN